MKIMWHFTRNVLCLLLVFSMLLGLIACTGDPQLNASSDPTTQPSSSSTGTTTPSSSTTTQPSTPTQPTDPTNPTDPTDPTQPVEPPVDENALVFTLTEEEVAEYYTLLEECEQLSIAGEDMDAIDAAMTALDEMYEYINAQLSISNVLYYAAMSNETLKQQYLDTVETFTNANDAYIQMARRVYQSDTPAKDALFEGWTEEDIEHLLNYDERITQLQQRNSEIKVEYQNSNVDSVKIPLYIEFVANNNEIAQFYGYSNYYDYASEMAYDRDYGAEELALMRQYVKQYLADSIDDAILNFQNSFNYLGSAKQTTIVEFLYNDYNTLSTNYVDFYLSNAPENLQEHTYHMLDADSLFPTNHDAMAGAFTTMIGERSYCFFGPGYANSCTVIHEAGHYYASRYADLNSIPLDLAETHSQGNEWLFMAKIKEKMPADTYKALVNYRMLNDLSMLMICLMVDEFEQRVYTTDLTGFTAADFDAIMESVCTQYFTLEFCSQNLTDIKAYWRMVVVEQPVYYVSYAVSSVAAMDLYTVARTDYDQAVNIYQKLCEEPVLEEGFLGNIIACGLSSPFDEEFYKEIVAIITG